MGPLLDVLCCTSAAIAAPIAPIVKRPWTLTRLLLGNTQLIWLKQALRGSKAIWKIIVSGMPLSLVIPDLNPDVPPGSFEAWANGDGCGPVVANWKWPTCSVLSGARIFVMWCG